MFLLCTGNGTYVTRHLAPYEIQNHHKVKPGGTAGDVGVSGLVGVGFIRWIDVAAFEEGEKAPSEVKSAGRSSSGRPCERGSLWPGKSQDFRGE